MIARLVIGGLLVALGVATCALIGSPCGRRSAAARLNAIGGSPRSVTSHRVPFAAALARWSARLDARRRARAGERPDADALAALLDRVARQCASGDSLGRSLGAALAASSAARSVVSPVFAPAATVLATGGTVRDAVARVATDQPDVVLAVHALTLCADQGGGVTESLDRVASALRERHGIRQERVAQSAQARMSARVLTLVPIGFAGWTMATTPSVQHFIATPFGVVCVMVGTASNIAGWRLMARAIRGAS